MQGSEEFEPFYAHDPQLLNFSSTHVDHSTAVKLAAQAALESISFNYDEEPELVFPSQDYQDISKNSMLTGQEVEEEEEEEEEENEDFIVTTYKGRFQCPRPNCSKVCFC
jgi:hypothetical protein